MTTATTNDHGHSQRTTRTGEQIPSTRRKKVCTLNLLTASPRLRSDSTSLACASWSVEYTLTENMMPSRDAALAHTTDSASEVNTKPRIGSHIEGNWHLAARLSVAARSKELQNHPVGKVLHLPIK